MSQATEQHPFHIATPDSRHAVVIVGAGTAGIAVAAQLKRVRPDLDIAIIDPAEQHYYQPAWTLVGAGLFKPEQTRRATRTLLPSGIAHIAQAVTHIDADNRQTVLADGRRIGYQALVIAAGIHLDWDKIAGLSETLGQNGVTSNYRYDLAPYTWELLRNFKGGTALFTQPATAVKCPGAPQKALYLAADHLRRRQQTAELHFYTGTGALFGVPFYARALEQVIAHYKAQPHFGRHLVAVDGPAHIATFETTVDGQTQREDVHFDLLHVVPPQSAPVFIRESGLGDGGGWLDIDKHTLQHARHADIFGLGDATSTPNSKTAAAIKEQAPVVAANTLARLDGKPLTAAYDGYAGCPVTTSAERVLLAEFTYGGVITPTLSLDPRVPRRRYGWLKKFYFPFYYWNILLKGRSRPAQHTPRNYPDTLPTIQP